MLTATDSGPAIDEDEGQVGVATRAVSWLIDAALINLVAIVVGIGIELIVSIFPISPNLSSVFKPIAAAVYAIWAAAYFIIFWSTTGQTPGARVMQIRMVTTSGKKLKPGRAVVRWIGMNLAMIPLFAGYLPILFGRRGFPDWLARTLVLRAPQISIAQARREANRAARRTVIDGHASRQRAGAANGQAPLSPSEVLDPTVTNVSLHRSA